MNNRLFKAFTIWILLAVLVFFFIYVYALFKLSYALSHYESRILILEQKLELNNRNFNYYEAEPIQVRYKIYST